MLNQDAASLADPCLARSASILRRVVLVMLFLTMGSTGIFLILLEDRPYGIQLSSIVGYTAAVAFYTSSRSNDNQRFLLSCPVVRAHLPQLVRRHVAFLATLFIIQTKALELRPKLPGRWITPSSKDASPFVIVLGVLCLSLGSVQILTNRSLLGRAHLAAQIKAV